MDGPTSIKLIPFDRDHFLEYQSWFSDEQLNAALGPTPDRAWFEFISSDQHGRQLSALMEGELVAVVGIVLPSGDSEKTMRFVITDLAVHPDRCGTGVGSRVLTLLAAKMQTDRLFAFVDQKNPGAKKFFENNGWVCVNGAPDEDGMYEFQSPVFPCHDST